ncbi:biotin-independent malonate decarboxylase subunit gamma [Terasakiispira papahanaumokuakeensis]|uniref:Biotin-independent malonate decarboxylase subunit gamma n=1 Tax=Terasakiispira papahanaumokuakeensis TaxID=197479 RepID=A0A1E2V9E2_9GAMM|nr:biotin-independent malonate decarboxylase subunit gamma [Terasakiispira papahanaumokuakeensis]ODC03543.1 biotin-independent malonate decarboxylase subunit gamma [Terasakiispira papahanaumokuakeensis]
MIPSETPTAMTNRGQCWFDALSTEMRSIPTPVASLQAAEGELGAHPCHLLLVKPDPDNLYPRARQGEVGLLEGWGLAQHLNTLIEADATQFETTASTNSRITRRTIVALVDVPSQAYGRREEALGIHQALAAAAGAYARARQAGHPVIALLVGKAMSGAFLAHGYQANAILALNDPGVLIHAMGKAAAARITQRSEEDLDRLAATIPPMAYDLKSYASLGLLHELLDVDNADQPSDQDVRQVKHALEAAQAHIMAQQDRGLSHRLAGKNRHASREVRAQLRAQWRTP